MKFEELINLAGEYLTGYLHDFIEILGHPSRRFKEPTKFNKGLWIFALISIFLGLGMSKFNLLPTNTDYAVSAIVILANWIALCVWGWLLSSRMLGGSASLNATIVIGVQVLAVSYVVSHFITLLVGVFLQPIVSKPDAGLAFVGVQTVMLGIYMTIALRALNGHSNWKTAILSVLVPAPIVAFNSLNLLIYALSGIEFTK